MSYLLCIDLKMFGFFQINCYYDGIICIIFYNLIMLENVRYLFYMIKGFEFQLIGKVCVWILDELDNIYIYLLS